VPVPVIFKGSGFYVTDHRNDNKGNGRKADAADAVKKSLEKTKAEVTAKAKE
jgi:predicted nucleic acid-binding Zn ribbon protein